MPLKFLLQLTSPTLMPDPCFKYVMVHKIIAEGQVAKHPPKEIRKEKSKLRVK